LKIYQIRNIFSEQEKNKKLYIRLVLDFFSFFLVGRSIDRWDMRCDILCLFPDVRKAAGQNSARSKNGDRGQIASIQEKMTQQSVDFLFLAQPHV